MASPGRSLLPTGRGSPARTRSARAPNRRAVLGAALNASAAFVYELTWRSPALAGELGAAHIVETPFVFDNLLPSLRGGGNLLGAATPPGMLATAMHQAWVEFVSSGSPGWTDYDLDTRTTMRIGDDWVHTPDPYALQRSA